MVLGRFLFGSPGWMPISRIYMRKNQMDKFFSINTSRHLTTIPPPPPPNEEGTPRRKKVAAALGAALAATGLAFAYKAYSDDLSVDYKAQCAEEDCTPPPKQCCEEAACLHKMDKEEELIAKANQELEKALKDVKPKAQEATEAALKAYCDSADLIKLFMDKAYCAIENDALDSPQFEEVWCDVYETAVKRCEKVKDGMTKGQFAWELLCRLREIIENGKNCKYTQCNPLLITAEETLLCAERELLNAKNRMDSIQSESRLVEQYRNLVEDFRRDLKAELESLLTSEDCKSTLTENECSMILTHAYKKVLRVQKELAQVQIEGAKEMDARNERDVVRALARQAQALQENFDTAKQAVIDEYERRLGQHSQIAEADNLVDLRAKYSQATSALAAMEEALKARHEADVQSEKFRKLWTYCNSVYNRINFAGYVMDGTKNDTVVIDKKSLLQEFPEDEFVKILIKSIPDNVSSAEELRERFFSRVDTVCRRVAIFKDDETVTLWKYFLGVLQSAFTTRCEGESEDKNVYAVLDRTALFLRRGELLEAVCTLNRIEAAVARKVCQDWLKDARAVLEANQTLFALMTHATNSQQ